MPKAESPISSVENDPMETVKPPNPASVGRRISAPTPARADGSNVAVPLTEVARPLLERAAVAAGAGMINDVMALRADGALETARDLDVPVCLMHMQGMPRTMQENPRYDDVVAEVREFLLRRVDACVSAGITESNLIIDPGFGFGKTLTHNLALLAHLDVLVSTGLPVRVGLSRKSMIARMLDRPVDQRVAASAALALIAVQKGASMVRVHDVAETADALRIAAWVATGGEIETE